MSDPLSNSEIQDVLSSIRRLVSEDRRARETRAPEELASEAVIGKLILTEAHRVEIVEETLIEVAVEAMPTAMAPVEEAPAEPGIDDSIRPASVLADDLASLESTIAELEAAVAGIGSEFEPDGSEVGPVTNDTATRQLEDAFDDGFIVDIGGPVRVEPTAEDKLDEPVTGSATAPTGPAEDNARARDEIAFLRSTSGARRPDWQVISGGESMSAAGSGLTGRLHLRPAETAEPVGPGDDDDVGDVAEDAALADDTVEVAEAMPVEEAAAEVEEAEESALDIPMDPDVEVAAAWEMMADAVPAVVEEPEAVALVEEPEPALAEEEAPFAIPDDLETPLMAAAAGLAGAASDPADEAEEDGLDLFASGDEAVIDMEMLRELIVQVLREELQGPLGERITRNVRKLVRQEIARALESQKFE